MRRSVINNQLFSRFHSGVNLITLFAKYKLNKVGHMGMRRRLGLAYSGMTAVLLFNVSGLYAAENTPNESQDKASVQQVFIEEMLVTAQKREQPLVDVPIAMTVFSQQTLDDLGVDGLQELSTFTPGIRVQEQSVAFTGISIRGITSDNTAPSQSPRVSVFQNGVDISRARGANVALYDLERIEALKGPQGTLFGRGAEVGAVSIVQHGADDELSGNLLVGAGSYNERKLQGYFNTPIVDGESALRASIYRHQRDGYVENLGGGELAEVDTTAARLAFNWQPSGDMQWQAWLNYQGGSPSGTPFMSFYFPEDDYYRDADVAASGGSVSDRTLWDATLRGDYQLDSELSLTSITAYREFSARESFDADGFALPILEFENLAEHQQFSQELRLNFDGGDRWKGFTGLNYHWENSEQELEQIFHEGYLVTLPKVMALLAAPNQPFNPELLRQPPPVYSPFAPLPQFAGIPLNSNMREVQFESVENHAADIFADVTYSLTDRLELTAGLRASYEDLSTSIETPPPPSPAGLSLLPQTCADGFLFQAKCDQLGQLTDRKLSQSEQYWGGSGRLLARYQVESNWSTYASYARGRRPNVVAYDTTSRENNLDSEVVDSFELGSKWRSADHKYGLDAAAFYFTYQNFITAVDSSTPVAVMEDRGDAVSKGVEIDVWAALSDSWSAFANTAYNDARIKGDSSYSGYRFRLAPLWSGALGLSHSHNLGGLGQGVITASYSYQSTVYFDDNNDANFGQNSQSGYGLANLRYHVASADQLWQLQLWANNLFDQEYIIDAGNTGALFGLDTYVPGSPRMLGASISHNF